MDNYNKVSAGKKQLGEAAGELLHEGKKFVSDFCKDSYDKVNEAQQCAKEYTEDLLVHVQKNPLTSVLIAAGIGFLLSCIIKK